MCLCRVCVSWNRGLSLLRRDWFDKFILDFKNWSIVGYAIRKFVMSIMKETFDFISEISFEKLIEIQNIRLKHIICSYLWNLDLLINHYDLNFKIIGEKMWREGAVGRLNLILYPISWLSVRSIVDLFSFLRYDFFQNNINLRPRIYSYPLDHQADF